jgi:integrase
MKYRKVLTRQEIQKLINHVENVYTYKRQIKQYKLIISTFINTGMRVSELINAKPTWIVPNGGDDTIIRIQSNKYPMKFTPKYVSEREVPISERLAEKLQEHIGNRKGGYIFRSTQSKNHYRLNKKTIINGINKISKSLFGETIGSHVFRATYASHIYSKFKDIIRVQKLLGHAKPEITWGYIRKIPTREKYSEITALFEDINY